MFQILVALLAAPPIVSAYPWAMQVDEQRKSAGLEKRYVPVPYRAPTHHINRPNTGLPPLGFDAEDQLVSVTGAHKWEAPTASDTRGQCPGLNAAANHGYLSRSGISTIAQAVEGLGAAYNMGADLAAFLAIVAVGLEGDPLTETWSIGKGIPTGLGSTSNGLYGLHNKYEGDSSIMRGDAYLNGGNVGVFQMRSFEHFYSLGQTFDFNSAAAQEDYVTRFSILNNPYYFSAPFSGLVAPAAHNLVINLMSNHSAAVPGGTLTRATLKSFFSVTGEPGSFVYTPGHERIPNNWYRRRTLVAHNIPEVLADLAVNNAAYPGILRFGGNTGTTGSFKGVSISDFSDGQYGSLADLLKGNNGACFLLQASLAGIPDVANPLLGELGSALGFVTSKLGPLATKFGCPQLSKFDNSFFNAFPGAKYTGTGTAK